MSEPNEIESMHGADSLVEIVSATEVPTEGDAKVGKGKRAASVGAEQLKDFVGYGYPCKPIPVEQPCLPFDTEGETQKDVFEKAEDENPGSKQLRRDLLQFMFRRYNKKDVTLSRGGVSGACNRWLCDNHNVVLSMNRFLNTPTTTLNVTKANKETDFA
jgi:hypothetical protein